MIIIMIITITLQIKKTPLVPQDQGLARVLGECRKQFIALKMFIIIIIIIIIY